MTSPRALIALRVVIAVVFVAGLFAFVVKGADNPADPTVSGARTPLAGFEETAVAVQAPMTLLEWCLLLAQTEQQQEQGLMNVTDASLGGYDGMLFRFEKDTTTPFWMKDTKLPLSIAYIDAGGKVVSMTDMEPCPEGAARCPLYPPAGPYRSAIEVPKGNFEKLGLTQDSTVTDRQTKCT